MKTIGLVYKKEDELIARTARQVDKDLKKKGYNVSLDKASFVIALGGDGTILRTARLLEKRGIPILGIHMGGVGFLSEIMLLGLDEALDQIKRGKYEIDERFRIEVLAKGKRIGALNDIVISKCGIARVIKIEMVDIADYTADGIIFSTATGSTAYNLSVGGPLLTPDSKSIVISAICPHSISTRPIVMDPPVELVLRRGKEVILTADGQEMIPLHEGDRVRIQKSRYKTRFIRIKPYNFFERVKETFGFGPKV
jgi:NAD+ kinase